MRPAIQMNMCCSKSCGERRGARCGRFDADIDDDDTVIGRPAVATEKKGGGATASASSSVYAEPVQVCLVALMRDTRTLS